MKHVITALATNKRDELPFVDARYCMQIIKLIDCLKDFKASKKTKTLK